MKHTYNLFSWKKVKNIALGLFALAYSTATVEAQVVTIGEDDYYKGNPIDPYYDYAYTQNIYLAAEVNKPTGGTIYGITYKCNPNIDLSKSNDWKIYMTNTSKSSFTGNTDWIAHTAFTEVFDAKVEASNGEVRIVLETPFEYNGTDNLAIAIDENTPDYEITGKFYNSQTPEGEERSIYLIKDTINPNPETDLDSLIATSFMDFIANIELDFTPITCFKATDLTAANITDSSAEISWTAPTAGTPTKYEYYYTTDSTSPDTDTVPSGETTTTSQAITGLASATEYNFWVRTVCSDTDKSDWEVGAFKTACGAYTAAYEDNFDTTPDDFSESCWSMIKEGNTTSIVDVYGYSNKQLIMKQGGDQQGALYLVSPNFSDLDNNKLISATVKRRYNSDFTCTFQIGVMTDASDFSSFQPLKDISNDITNSVVQVETTTLDYQGSGGYVAFKYTLPTDDTYNDILIDEFTYETMPSCMKPVGGVDVTDITGESATVSWDASISNPAGGYEYYYATIGAAPTATTEAIGTVTDTAVTITELESTRVYYVWVRSVCSDIDKSVWTAGQQFETVCAEETASYENNFDGPSVEGNLPECWTKLIEGSTNNNSEIKHKIDYTFGDIGKSVNIYHSGDKDGQYYFISPRFSDLDNAKQIRVQVLKKLDPNSIDTDSGVLEIGIMTNNTDSSTYVQIQNIPLANLTQLDWTEIIANTSSYSGGAGHIVFKYTPGTSGWNRFYFDEFKYEQIDELSTEEFGMAKNNTVVYPNPFQDIVSISKIDDVSAITVLDITGKVVRTFEPKKEISIGDLNAAIYFIQLSYTDGSLKTLKLIRK